MQKLNRSTTDFAMTGCRRNETMLDVPLGRARSLPELEESDPIRRISSALRRLMDSQPALAISCVLFALGAWPLALCDVPPYQDLPNHLAAVTILQHPELYPEFVSNGFFKTNAALFAWLHFIGGLVGTNLAARLFALLVVAANALVLPRFVLEFTSRRKLWVASLFMWPMVHNWFVSMGMLDFALGVPLSLVMLILLNRQRTRPTWTNALAIMVGGMATWYAHVFALLVVHLLVLVHLVTQRSWRERFAELKTLAPPLVPVATATLISLYCHWTEPVGAMTGFVKLDTMIPPWELAYNLWAEWFWGFTWLSISSIVPCVALGLIAIHRRQQPVMFFSPAAFGVLTALFLLVPYVATNWFHVNSRFIPFLWMAALVRVPERLPKPLVWLCGVSALLYTVGMGIDFVRLDQDRAAFTAGVSAVPERARLLPLVFKPRLTSQNTRSLLHAWGFYVTEKHTSAPLLFAHSRSFPIMYREAPPPQFNHLVLESFAPNMANPAWACNVLRSGGLFVADCDAAWKERWAEFWRQALPLYDHVLMWDAPLETEALVPSQYRVLFRQQRLTIYQRLDTILAQSLE